MSASGSTSAECKSILVVIESGTSIKTVSITNHTGLDNYHTCETQVEDLFLSIDGEEIVLENL
jgi:hypothetical protein